MVESKRLLCMRGGGQCLLDDVCRTLKGGREEGLRGSVGGLVVEIGRSFFLAFQLEVGFLMR